MKKEKPLFDETEKHVYCVRIEHEVYVVAEDEEQAQRIGKRAMRDEPTSLWEVDSEPIVDLDEVPRGARDSLPWGEDLRKRRAWTIEEWLNSERAKETK